MKDVSKTRTLWLTTLALMAGICLGMLLPRAAPAPAVAAMSGSVEDEAASLFDLTVVPALPEQAFSIQVLPSAESTRKKVLLYHTHTYEAYEKQEGANYKETQKWRTDDAEYNMVRVGRELAGLLRGLGFDVVHDEIAFEPPDLGGAYARSLDMLTRRKAAGERYDLYIDLHRDAFSPSQASANAVAVGDRQAARLMCLIGKGEGQTAQGFAERPDWQTNLAVAKALTDSLNAQHSGLAKEVMVKSGRYNQHVTTPSVLIEVGNNRNTLSEALASMPYLADAIRQALGR